MEVILKTFSKTLVAAALLTSALVIPSFAAGKQLPGMSKPKTFNFEVMEDFVEVYKDSEVYYDFAEPEHGKSCGGASFDAFMKVVSQEGEGLMRLSTKPCGDNVYVCVDMKEKQKAFKPQWCGTLAP